VQPRSENTFSKKDRLSGRTVIGSLFDKGHSFNVFPLRVIWLPENSRAALQAGVAVSSRHFKRAVDRNRIKRMMKEAYRLQKFPLKQHLVNSNKQLSVFFIFIGNEIPAFDQLFPAMEKVIRKLTELTSDKN
jgi:ribonuclease P protein component